MKEAKQAAPQGTVAQPDLVAAHGTASHAMGLIVQRFNNLNRFITELLLGTAIPLHTLRLGWSCRCGYASYDDFSELASGAVNTMANELLESGYVKIASIDSRTAGAVQSVGRNAANIAIAWRNIIFPRQSKPGLPTAGSLPATLHSATHEATAQCRFLHICIEKGPYSTRLHCIDMCDKLSDRVVFDTIRTSYTQLRSEINGILSRIRQIDFVEFQMCPGELVDLLMPNRIPPSCNTEYEPCPVPPSTRPLIGPNFMMHMLHCREGVQDKNFFVKRFPRKITPCTFSWEGTNNGWGLHLAEGLNVSLLIWSLFIFTSAVFGVFWTLLKDDIFGAFTIASYITALMTLLLITVISAIVGV